MRILKCGFKPVGGLWCSDAAHHIVVANGGYTGPYLEVHSLFSDTEPARMDQHPGWRWVTGYSDAENRLQLTAAPPTPVGRHLFRPGIDDTPAGLSSDTRRSVVSHSHAVRNLSQLQGYTRTPKSEWSQKWQCEVPGFFEGPVWFFRNNTRFVMRRKELTRTSGFRTTSHLMTFNALNGKELATSPPLKQDPSLITSLGSGIVVSLDTGPRDQRTSIIHIFSDDTVDAGSVELPQRGRVTALAPDPLGRFLLSAVGTKVTVWDPAVWKPIHTFDWKIGRVTCLAISADGTVAAAGGDKGKVVVWDVE